MLKKSIASFAIASYFFLVVVDGVPDNTVIHQNLKPMVKPILNFLGQWQGNLKLFAPVPDHMNSHLEAKLVMTDGTETRWRTPDWQKMGPIDKFVNYRMMRYSDQVRLDSYSRVWPFLAAYLVKDTERETGKKVQHIAISRHWVLIDPPPNPFYNAWSLPQHSLSYTFYEKGSSR